MSVWYNNREMCIRDRGDWTWVKVIEIDDRGRVNLSRKDALKERAEMGLKD